MKRKERELKELLTEAVNVLEKVRYSLDFVAPEVWEANGLTTELLNKLHAAI